MSSNRSCLRRARAADEPCPLAAESGLERAGLECERPTRGRVGVRRRTVLGVRFSLFASADTSVPPEGGDAHEAAAAASGPAPMGRRARRRPSTVVGAWGVAADAGERAHRSQISRRAYSRRGDRCSSGASTTHRERSRIRQTAAAPNRSARAWEQAHSCEIESASAARARLSGMPSHSAARSSGGPLSSSSVSARLSRIASSPPISSLSCRRPGEASGISLGSASRRSGRVGGLR
mmetsp:Transcript_9836/g.31165  ORF Transcript_9836/g.31165 Transcript_9836/m.31165 type:complete len:236 (+) Transcript_9836:945-1652(+)